MPLIERRSLAVEVSAKIQEQIQKGEYAVNQQLPIEQKLMDIFGVGRSTVREAVKILVNSGYVRVQQGIGTFVEDNAGVSENIFQLIKKSDRAEIAEVRRLLEMKIAEKAAVNRTGNDISKMEHHLKKQDNAAAAKLSGEYAEAHLKFYHAMADASKNQILTELYKSFTQELKRELLDMPATEQHFNTVSDLHHKLLDSIIRQDASRAWYWSGKLTGQIS